MSLEKWLKEEEKKEIQEKKEIEIRNKKCSNNECRNTVDFNICYSNFEKKFYGKIDIKKESDLEKRKLIMRKFKEFWTNPKVSFFCCSCYKKYEEEMKERKKHKRLINKVKRICDKYKFIFKPNEV